MYATVHHLFHHPFTLSLLLPDSQGRVAMAEENGGAKKGLLFRNACLKAKEGGPLKVHLPKASFRNPGLKNARPPKNKASVKESLSDGSDHPSMPSLVTASDSEESDVPRQTVIPK